MTFNSSIRAASPSGKSGAKMLSASARVIPGLGISNTLSNTSACGLGLNLNAAILPLCYAYGREAWCLRPPAHFRAGLGIGRFGALRLPLVVQFLALGDRDFALDAAVLQVDLDGDQGQALFPRNGRS